LFFGRPPKVIMVRRIRRVRLRLPSNPRQAAVWLLALAVLVLLPWWYAQPEALAPGVYQVERVVDGDTLVLANQQRVRLIGADTPETVKPDHPIEPWGPEATEFTRRFVAGGEVRLEFDGPRKDKYGRYLAHVWVGNRMLEEELIRAGLATAETRYRYSSAMKARLLKAQSSARTAGRGIWSGRVSSAGNL
jgi:micrococcal nuclease